MGGSEFAPTLTSRAGPFPGQGLSVLLGLNDKHWGLRRGGLGGRARGPSKVPRVTSLQLPPLPTKEPDDPGREPLFLVRLNERGGGEVTSSSSLILAWTHFLAGNEGGQRGAGALGVRGCPGEAGLSALSVSVDTSPFVLGGTASHSTAGQVGDSVDPSGTFWATGGGGGMHVRLIHPQSLSGGVSSLFVKNKIE